MAGIVPGPHIHIETKPPATGAVQVAKVVALETLQGANFTVPSMPVPRFCVVTVISPVVAAVATLATYLLVGDADSQPQVLAVAGKAVVVCTVSVIDVRQVDAARMTSDTFARTV